MEDLAVCLQVTADSRLALHDVPEGTHVLHLPRIGKVGSCLTA